MYNVKVFYDRNKMVVYAQNETVCSCCQTRIGSIGFSFVFIYFFVCFKKNICEFLNNIERVLAVFS